MTRNLTLSLTAVLAGSMMLSACGTPQEQCVARNTREYRVVSNLLAEVEGNLARGYAWQEREITRTEWRDCPVVVRDRDGNPQWRSRPCLRDVSDTERFRVAIDPAAERRKAENLRQRQAALRSHAEAAIRACREAFPEPR